MFSQHICVYEDIRVSPPELIHKGSQNIKCVNTCIDGQLNKRGGRQTGLCLQFTAINNLRLVPHPPHKTDPDTCDCLRPAGIKSLFYLPATSSDRSHCRGTGKQTQ